jgi:hypothetical protein
MNFMVATSFPDRVAAINSSCSDDVSRSFMCAAEIMVESLAWLPKFAPQTLSINKTTNMLKLVDQLKTYQRLKTFRCCMFEAHVLGEYVADLYLVGLDSLIGLGIFEVVQD